MRISQYDTDRIAKALRMSLEDLDGVTVRSRQLTEVASVPIWVIEVDIEGYSKSLFFNPHQIDNGAHGIHEVALIEIRRAAGEDIPYKVVTAMQFNDLNTLDPIPDEDISLELPENPR